MNRIHIKAVIGAVAMAATVVASQAAIAQEREAPVALNMESLVGTPVHVRERILTEAQKGSTALIQYLHRTQSVHQLRPQTLIKEQQPVFAMRHGETKVAARPVEATK